LDDFSQSFILDNGPPQHPTFMSISDFDSITFTTPNTHPTPRTTSIVNLENTRIKRKQLSMFLLIVETNDKNKMIIMDTMDRINIQVNMTESHKKYLSNISNI
jgi:hypothetical protein